MSVSGYATLEGTTRYRDRFPNAAPHHFRQQQNLLLSSIGIGTYLGNADAATDRNYLEAVVRTVQLGGNVIDSAANYRFQRSERSIGQALQILINEQGFGREEFVVCTKGGYLPFAGAPPRNIRGYIEETFVQPGIASLDDFVGGSHCMTPRYLQNQIEQSLRNLSLDCLDVYYIHNPESQLSHVSATEFDHRLSAAFALLEENRAQGRLRMYGVATWNGFRLEADDAGYHSLPRMVALAKQVGGENHGFRFIQLPFNLGMPEALTLPNQMLENEERTVLETAAALGVTVVASASMLQGRVARDLPDNIKEPLGSLTTDAQTAIQFVRSTPGITTALVGMSRVEHVVENLQLTGVEPVGEAQLVRLAT
jgi:aryl-alcohol dehydrogenase-like predicted oxidoreductase